MHMPKIHYQISPDIWVGSYIGNGIATHVEPQLRWLLAQGVTLIIDLTAPSDDLPTYLPQLAQHAPQITWMSFAINDGDVPAPATMLAILDTISEAQRHNKRMYIHSWRGISRTGMVVSCWLIRQGFSANTAYQQMKQKLPTVVSSAAPDFQVQIDFVYNWNEPDAQTAQRWRRWRDVFRGALIGGAVGDALGVTNEHTTAQNVQQVTDIVGGGPFALPAGWWSDDTASMLCVVTSLIAQRGFNSHDHARRLLQLWREGYLACGGRIYDFGNVNMMALYQYMVTNNPYTAITSDHTASTGSFVRVAPVGLFFAADSLARVEYTRDSSRITHGSPASIHACQVVTTMLARTIYCQDKAMLLTHYWLGVPHTENVYQMLIGKYHAASNNVLKGTYVIDALQMVLQALRQHDDFASGILALANMGGMQQAGCTVYGQIAGAFYGESAIPLHWRQTLMRYHEIAWYADTLLQTVWTSLPHTSHIPPGLFADA